MLRQGFDRENIELIYTRWQSWVQHTAWVRKGTISFEEIERLGKDLLVAIGECLQQDQLQDNVKQLLKKISLAGLKGGLTPAETAEFVFSIRQVLSQVVPEEDLSRTMELLDRAGLYTFEVFLQTKEDTIKKQQQDLWEISTPVIKMWDGILVVPLIGTIDSKRTQQVMERLLTMIVESGAKVAILDITGVATVDTLVANHILKTAAAVRLLGANLIITGISPVIAQTMVQLGVDLGNIVTRAIMADGVALAFQVLNKEVVDTD